MTPAEKLIQYLLMYASDLLITASVDCPDPQDQIMLTGMARTALDALAIVQTDHSTAPHIAQTLRMLDRIGSDQMEEMGFN
jgi:hypothetical protein